MNTTFYVALYSDGALKFEDLRQCRDEKWIPIATIKTEETIIVPCFSSLKVARDFTKRNIPRKWQGGVIALSDAEIKWMNDKGWHLAHLDFPRLVKDVEGFGYEVLELQNKPKLEVHRQ